MDPPARAAEPWYRRAGRKAKELWRTEDSRVAILRDVLVAALVVGLLLAAVWGYTGQPFPNQAPLVVVESGSMMHGPHRSGFLHMPTGWGDPPFGRIGTIDPGDLVFVKDVDRESDIEPAFGSGERSGYGAHGDVIVWHPFGGSRATPVIHRAMLFVEAQPNGCTPGTDCVYRVPAACGERFGSFVASTQVSPAALCAGTSEPITIELEHEGLYLKLTQYPCESGCGPFYSSFITRGDNNPSADQFTSGGSTCFRPGEDCISAPVRLDWIIGKARGEVPWFGLIKLALYGNSNYSPASDPSGDANWKILRATAPWDIWMGLLLALGLIVATPIAIDLVRHRLRKDDGPDEEDARDPRPPSD